MERLNTKSWTDILHCMNELESDSYNSNGYFAFFHQLVAFKLCYSILLMILGCSEELDDTIFSEDSYELDCTGDFLEFSIEQSMEFGFPYKKLLESTSCNVFHLNIDFLAWTDEEIISEYGFDQTVIPKLRTSIAAVSSFLDQDDIDCDGFEDEECAYLDIVKVVHIPDMESLKAETKEGAAFLSLCKRCILHAAMEQDYFIEGKDWYILHFYTHGEAYDNIEYMTSPSFFLALHLVELFKKGELI